MRLEFDDQNRRAVAEPVPRGEWIESVVNEKRYQPLYSENIDPQNRTAILSYQAADVLGEPGSSRRLIDRFI